MNKTTRTIPIPEMIKKLKILRAIVEWDYSLEYNILLDEVIEVLNGLCEKTDGQDSE